MTVKTKKKKVSPNADYKTEILKKIRNYDSLVSRIKKTSDRIDKIIQFSYENIENKEVTIYCMQRLKAELPLSVEPEKSKIRGLLYALKGTLYWQKSAYENCVEYFGKATDLIKKTGDRESEAYLLQITAFALLPMGEIESAFKSAYSSIEVLNDIPKSPSRGWTFYCLGVLYAETKDYDKSLHFYKQALKVFTNECAISYGQGRALIGIGNTYKAIGKLDLAEKSIRKSIDLFRDADHKVGLTRASNDLGVILRQKGEFVQAEKILLESLELRNRMGHLQGSITTLYELGELKNKQKNFSEAEKYLKKALKLVQKTNTKNKEVVILRSLSNSLKALGKMDEAMDYLEQYVRLKELLSGEETSRKLQRIETRLATERAEKEAEIERLRNVELKQAHDLIAEKNKEILDSIKYAKRIQGAMLPPVKHIRKHLKESFVLYLPKDIVAGDFYWMEKRGHDVWFAVADCTGHGVPGAMVSVVCFNALTKAVVELGLTEPAEILNEVRKMVVNTFKRSEEEVKDGMDIALCRLNLKNLTLTFSGAHNSLYHITKKNRTGNPVEFAKGRFMLSEYKGDKQPIGHFTHERPFAQINVQLKKSDSIYISSDGYVDQFGGPEGRKFMNKKLKHLLLSIHTQTMEIQRQNLLDEFLLWKKNERQVDDVCVMGFRIF